MGVDRERQVLREQRGLDGERGLGDQFAGAGAGDAGTEQAPGLRIDDELRDAIATPERRRAAGGGPPESRDATARPSAAACVSVRPHQAISGSVKTTAGTTVL